MPLPLRRIGRALFALLAIGFILALTAYWVLVVRGVPLAFASMAGRMETLAPAPALDGKEFSHPGYPVLSFHATGLNSFAVKAVRVEARRHLRLRPFELYDAPTVAGNALRAAMETWVQSTAPGTSVSRIELYPYLP